MHYIIIGIIVIAVIWAIAKYVLFDPRINSGIYFLWFLYLCICVGIAGWGSGGAFGFIIGFIIVGIGMADCIRDIVMAKKYYESIDVEIDKFYMIKSLTSLFTIGLARIVYFLIVHPALSFMVSANIKKQMRSGQPLPYFSFYSNMKIRNYYYEKQIEKLEKKGVLISNKETVDYEAKIRQDKLDRLYPKKIVAKIVDMVAGDKEIKEKRKRAEQRLLSMEKCYAYLSADWFAAYPNAIIAAMTEKGRCSVSSIQTFNELKTLNLLCPVIGNAKDRLTEWSEYFIIQALQPLVAQGVFSDDDFNDNDAMDNHAYQYAESKKRMPSINADEDPRFALDD